MHGVMRTKKMRTMTKSSIGRRKVWVLKSVATTWLQQRSSESLPQARAESADPPQFGHADLQRRHQTKCVPTRWIYDGDRCFRPARMTRPRPSGEIARPAGSWNSSGRKRMKTRKMTMTMRATMKTTKTKGAMRSWLIEIIVLHHRQ